MKTGVGIIPSGLIVVSALGACSFAVLTAGAQKQRNSGPPAPACKITPVEAINIALKKSPGRALNANFEFDEGKWVYGVMVVSGSTIKEIEIDPMSGKIDDSETVTPEGEAKELQSTLSKAISKTPARSKSIKPLVK